LRNTEPSSWPRSPTSTTSAQNTKCSLETKFKNNIFFSSFSFKPFLMWMKTSCKTLNFPV
jgi:hypothetical protein